ncbi:MAG: DUF393 domain-containing protein [Bacteroidetes bacterium SB0662_bin_6]|nr:DUF393 domain-containing protein [Bacteroidetes bacterium SB0668_bin_1]MYE04193.1 DUF393 domain-containing protein [Bacteroidetes bacterium SB0662_bin_6]
MDDPGPVILFDGECNFCNATVRWTASREKHKRLHFASLQSRAARRIIALADPGIDFEALPDSLVFVDEEGVHTDSTANLRIARHLRFPWSLLVLAQIIPRPLRDAAYRSFARNRYRWFGRSDACPASPPDFAARFLDTEEEPGVDDA